jgi:molybdopterin-guanine dinucleotide biosynthesis protein A
MGTAIVLAGGSGSRLGGAKATVLLGGRPLIDHVLDAARAGGLEPVVVAKADSSLPPLDCRLVIEPEHPRHPLCGIVAGLNAITEDGAVVCACDMPFVSGELLAWLEGLRTPLAVAAIGGRLQPLLGRYSASLLDQLEDELAAQRPMREVARELGALALGEAELRRFGDPLRLCLNINTPAELAAAGG